jgi:hypothetical protein
MQEVKKEIKALLLKAKENNTPIEITSNDLCQLFANNMKGNVLNDLKTIQMDPLYSRNRMLHLKWHQSFLRVLEADEKTKHLATDFDTFVSKISPIIDESFERLHNDFIVEVLNQREKDKQEIENLKEMLRLFVQGTKITLESLEKK